MISSSLWTAFVAATFTALASAQTTTVEPIPSPTAEIKMNKMEPQGCFSSYEPLLDYGPYEFQTPGNCQPICGLLGKTIMAISDGSNCYCGDLVPAEDTKVSDDECNTPCNGFDQTTCGGNRRYQVWTSGLNRNQPEFYVPAASSSAVSTPTNLPQENTSPTDQPEASSSSTGQPSSNGPNTAAIAAGVVVGVVVVAAIIGGFVLFMKRRRKIQAEESYKRHASVNDFVGKPPGTGHSSLTDTRLDPEAMMRRQSDGSIADNQDYSRRILQVRNF